ncbi:MAG: hypothetical protein IJL24_04470, partial [Treponema sp.]|nr:hypothetical protein [Treponema sp.]
AKGKYYAEERFSAADESDGFVAADYNADEFSDITAPADSDTPGVNKYVDSMPVAPNYTMDIVPYITSVKTSLSAVNETNGVTDRSSLGAYPVYVYKNSTATAQDVSAKAADDKESVKVYGFNLKGAKYGAASLPYTDGYVSVDSDTITPGAFALTVNGVGTLNNSNNNNAKGSYTTATEIEAGGTYSVYKHYYNRQPNNANNNNLTDDVAFDVWQLNNKAAAPMGGNVEDPQMKIIPGGSAKGKIGFAFGNGPNAFSMPNSTYSWSYWAYDFQGTRYTALAYDPAGYAWAAAAGQDTSASGGDSFYIESNRWREHGGWTDGKNHYWDMTKHGYCKLERLCVGGTVMNDRIQSPSIAATDTSLYMAYFDDKDGIIRYKAGDYSGGFDSGTHSSGVWDNGSGQSPTPYREFGFFKDEATESSMAYSEDNVQVVVGTSSMTDSGRGNTTNNVCIAAINGGATRTDDVVLMVWNDRNTIKYMHTLGDPITTETEGGKTKLKAVWSTPVDVFDRKIGGRSCVYQIAVDKNGGVHIAASTGSDLWYAYLADYKKTGTSDVKIARVDSYESTGDYITIDAALDANGNPAPQIGFYSASSSHPKYARWN